MAMIPLQQTLKSLCSRTGWCYAVFWKLKRRSRMMLTWEDGYYDYSSDSCNSLETGGNPLDQGGSGDLEGQIGLAVARMSYYVYSMGEGIIGRVAFTGKHQWVFHNGESNLEHASGDSVNNQSVSFEKNPDGWQNQFAAGIKTIAVIAVPQGVVQLGSTKLMMEDLKWIDHIKSIFGALQTVPSVLRSDLPSSEGQGGRSTYNQVPPFVSSSSASTTARRQVAGQTSLRNAEDAACLRKYSVQPSPTGPLKMQGPQSVGGSVLFSNVPSDYKRKVVTQVDIRVHPTKEMDEQKQRNIEAEFCSELARRGLMNGNVSSGLHNEIKRDMGVPTHVEVKVDEGCSLSQSDACLGKRFGMHCLPGTKQEEESSVSSCFGTDYPGWQQLDMQTQYMLKKHPPILKSPVDDCLENVNLAVSPTCPLPAGKKMMQNDSYAVHQSISESDIIPAKSESVHGVEDPFFPIFPSQDATSTLDELEKFLAKEQSGSWDCSFAIGDELSQALRPAFRRGGTEEVPASHEENNEELRRNRVEISKQHAMVPTWEPNFLLINSHKSGVGVCFPESNVEPLLDAIVGNASNIHHSTFSTMDASFSNKIPFANMTSGMPALNMSKEREPKIEACNSYSGQGAPHHQLIYQDNGVKNLMVYQNLGVYNDMYTNMAPHSWTDEGLSFKSDDTRQSQSKKSEELSKSGKKRSRSGESSRPRPKDRQQIQDRVRELRDIVPNGSKCSIDALLEKTIKHMLFLHSVTLHADQLKNSGDFKEDPNSGASWAVDLGSQDKRCPILVKDLKRPRQMLVEMKCEESDLFLEIADVIRSLGLTILKGVMESQNDEFWAKFVVEANRDVQRVDVLVSLIQRLHLDNNSSSSSMTIASQSAHSRPQQHGVDSSSSQTVCGNK